MSCKQHCQFNVHFRVRCNSIHDSRLQLICAGCVVSLLNMQDQDLCILCLHACIVAFYSKINKYTITIGTKVSKLTSIPFNIKCF